MFMKKIWIMLLLLFLCGIISGDFIAESLKEDGVLLGIEVYKEYAYAKPLFEVIFWQILFERCKCLMIVVILILTPLKKIIPLILIGLAAFILGFFIMSNMISLGAVGLLIAIVTFLPQLLFYGGMTLILYRGHGRHKLRQGEKIAFRTLTIVVAMMLFVAGCMVECLVGVHLIPWMIRLSLI
jgi:hypothetical protein